MTLDVAREAIYGRATELAREATPEQLAQVADAVQKVAYGPCGQDSTYRYTADYHHTQHPGEQRNPPGFARENA